VKKACPYCRESYVPQKSVLDKMNKKVGIYASLKKLKKLGLLSYKDHGDIRFFKTNGCSRCAGKGYSGRVGIFEIFNIDKKLQSMILAGKHEKAIQEFAESRGMLTLFEDGLLKALNGLTTIEEVIEKTT
jgi:type IV pilus assembly protein PilB